MSQNCDTLDVATYDYEIEVPAMTLHEGDTALLLVNLGTPGKPVSRAVAFDIAFTVSKKVRFPDPKNIIPDSSWLLDGPGADTTLYLNAAENRVRLVGERIDGETRTGFGELFRIFLVVTEDDVAATELLDHDGGGIVIVENVDWKRASNRLSRPADIKVWPNPCRGDLNFEAGGSLPGRLRVLDLSGREYLRVEGTDLAAGSVDLGALPNGLYLLQFLYPDGSALTRRLRMER